MKNLGDDYDKVVETLIKDPKSYDDSWPSERSEDLEDVKSLFESIDGSWNDQ